MADHRHHQHRPNRLSVPPRTTTPTTPGPYPTFPYTSPTPTPTPSKTRRLFSSSKSKSSLSFLFLLLFSLRSLYSLLPFLRSSPSFSLFPFSFLVSLLSFFLTFSFSLFSSSSSSSHKDPFHFHFHHHKSNQPLLGFFSITHTQQRTLVFKSALLALVFLLRFQALRYCGTAAMILAEFMGSVAARFVAGGDIRRRNRWSKLRGFVSLFLGSFMLAFGWDQAECFPFPLGKGKTVIAGENCVRIWHMLLPFMAGFIGCCERVSMDWGTIKQLGQKRVRLITLLFTTIVLSVPAAISFFALESEGDSVEFGDLAWPLANTVVFGVLLSENYTADEKLVSSNDTRKEFLITFVCILLLELFYFPELSLWGLLICGLLLYVAVRDLDSFRSGDLLGFREESSEFSVDMIMKPIRHILSERKSRKIALFLLINTGYMVVEFVAGFMSNSLGLISDACHMLFDCAALAIGLYASYISRLPANNQHNYGRGRFEVLSGYSNAVFLVLVGALIVVESLERILDPQEISTSSLLVVSIGGLVVNVIGLIFFHEEHHHAHGGSGSCSHSHSHSHSHHHHHDHDLHSHGKHHHVEDGSNEVFMKVSSDCQNNSCHGDLGHHHHSSHQMEDKYHVDNHKIQSLNHHDHTHHHHDHHDHTQHHDHHDHTHHHHDHHDHAHHHHDHHDHTHHHHDHHDHTHQHDHNDHQHHPHHHHDANHHSHEASPVHHLEVDDVASSRSEGVGSSTRNCDSHQKKVLSNEKEPQEHSHRHIDHNMEGIFLHVLADTLGSVGVVISTLLIKYKGWLIADPACSIFISVLIISSVIPLLRNSAEVLLQRVPRVHEHELKDALSDVLKIKGVYGIQKFHVWSCTNADVVGTLHLHVSTDTDKTSAKSQVSRLLHNAGIKDLTVQVECVR